MAETEIDYVLKREIKLNLPHYLWTELFHVDDLDELSACTSIWLTDLARRLPCTACLDGFDVFHEAAPPAGCLPPNVAFHQYDIHSDAPDYLRGIYDIVHVRNTKPCASKQTKPSGYLQLGEPDVSSLRIEHTAPNAHVSALNELTELTLGIDARLRPTWCGVGDVQAHIRDAPLHLALANHECNLVLHELTARKMRSTAVGQRLADLMPHAVQETRAGVFCAFKRWNVVGRKAA
ncbi:hypothetical protein BDW72DRAFT_205214 [Aspergillus terricola var. indicus]